MASKKRRTPVVAKKNERPFDKENSKAPIEDFSPEWIARMIDEHPKKITHFDQHGDLNLLYKAGDTARSPDGFGGTVDTEFLNRESTTFNIEKSNMMIRVAGLYNAKFNSELPFPKVVPDDEKEYWDIFFKAKEMNELLHDWWKEEKVESLLQITVDSLFWTGYGVLHMYYDSEAGELQMQKGEMVEMPGGSVKEIEDDIYEGRIFIEAIPTRDYFPDPTARIPRDRRWVIIRRRKPTGDLEEKFGLPKGSIKPNEDDGGQYLFMASTPAGRDSNNEATVYELFALPCRRYPRGNRKVCYKDKIFLEEDFNYKHLFTRELKISCHDNGTTNLPVIQGIVARDAQRAINKSRAAVMENLTSAGSAIFTAQEGSKVEEDIVSGIMILKYPKDAKEPNVKSPPALPAYIVSHSSQVYANMMEEVGLTPAGSGQLGARMSQIAGSLVDTLLMQEKNYFSSAISDYATFISEICYDFFELQNERRDGPEFMSGSKFPGIKKVDIELGTAIGQTFNQKMERMLVKLQQGIISPEDYLMAERNNGNMKPKEDMFASDLEKAARNLLKILGKSSPPDIVMTFLANPDAVSTLITKYDNVAVHKEYFINFIKKEAFEDLPDKFQDLVIRYIEACEAIEMQMQANQISMQGNQQEMTNTGQVPKQAAPGMNGRPPEGIEQAAQQELQGGF